MRKVKIEECNFYGKLPEEQSEVVDNVDNTFTSNKTLENRNKMQNATDKDEIATPILGLNKTEFKLDFNDNWSGRDGLFPVDKIPADNEGK